MRQDLVVLRAAVLFFRGDTQRAEILYTILNDRECDGASAT